MLEEVGAVLELEDRRAAAIKVYVDAWSVDRRLEQGRISLAIFRDKTRTTTTFKTTTGDVGGFSLGLMHGRIEAVGGVSAGAVIVVVEVVVDTAERCGCPLEHRRHHYK